MRQSSFEFFLSIEASRPFLHPEVNWFKPAIGFWVSVFKARALNFLNAHVFFFSFIPVIWWYLTKVSFLSAHFSTPKAPIGLFVSESTRAQYELHNCRKDFPKNFRLLCFFAEAWVRLGKFYKLFGNCVKTVPRSSASELCTLCFWVLVAVTTSMVFRHLGNCFNQRQFGPNW